MFKGSLAQGPVKAQALQVSTTAIGQAIPITYGYDRVDARLIYWANFVSHGGSSGFFGSGGSGTTYTVNADLILGYGPLEGVADLWSNGVWNLCYSDIYSLSPGAVIGGQTVNFTVPSTSSANPNGALLILIAGVFISNVPYSVNFSDYVFPGVSNNFTQSGTGIIPCNNANFPGPNLKNYNTSTVPYARYNSTPGSYSGSVTFPTGITAPVINVVYYFADHTGGIPIPINNVGLSWEAQLGSGSSGQPVLYHEFTGLSGANINLGGSPVFPQSTFHTKGFFGLGWPTLQGSMSAWTSDPLPVTMPSAGDCNVADVMVDLITSGNDVARFGTSAVWNHGACFNSNVYDGSGSISNTLQYSRYGGIIVDENVGFGLNKVRNYCLAYTILVSGTLSDQSSCAQVLTELAEIANSAPVWNGANLDFIPYCEVSNFGNGATYQPAVVNGPVFNLGPAHFLVQQKKKGSSTDKPPLVATGGLPSDNYNSLAINFKDRTGQTNNNVVVLSDAFDISRQGQMPQGSKSYNWIQVPSIATAVGWALLRRNVMVLRHGVYKFDLPASFSPILSLMDLVSLSDTSLGSFIIPVRITKIEENEDFSVTCEAERYVYGACVPVAPGTSVGISSGGGGSGGGGSAPVPSVNTPIIFEAIPAIASQQQLWFCVSGPTKYTGGVTSITVTNGGSGYFSPPSVNISGDGAGATAVAQIGYSGGFGSPVLGITVITPGSGYTFANVTLTGGTNTAAASAVLGNFSASYGGCVIMMSTDGGTSYNYINGDQASSTILGNQTMGAVYSSNYPSHADPDAADTLFVDLTESNGVLPAFTAAQRDAFLSLSYLAGGGTTTGPNGTTLTIPYELVAYDQSSLQSAGKYASNTPPSSGNQIRRGVYGTPVAVHNIGTAFSYLGDSKVFKWNLPSSLIGTTLNFKFLSFNTVGGQLQGLADATAYTFTPTGQVGWSQVTYAVTPAPAVYQGQSGGWSGVDTNSGTWTNTAFVYIPPTTATFSNGKVLNYAARDSGFNVFTVSGGGETVWVTVNDPSQVGEPGGTASLTMYADLNQTRWNSPGYTRIGTITSKALSGGGGSGGGGGSSSSGPWDLTVYVPVAMNQITTNEIFRGRMAHNMAFGVNFAGSVGDARVLSTGTVTFNVNKNGVSQGTVVYNSGSSGPAFSCTAFSYAVGDEITITWTGVADATLAGFTITLTGIRS